MKKPIGILGGTFDPVHNGHLFIARALYSTLDWQEVRFIPCQQPVLKKPTCATAEQRLAMLKLALAAQPGFVIDEQELQRTTLSYTVDTLVALRKEFGDTPLCLILGSDNLTTLPQWHRWQELITLAHFVIVMRPDYALPTEGLVGKLLVEHQVNNPAVLQQKSAGAIFISDIKPPAISATQIRQQLSQGLQPQHQLPETVLHYIQQHHLYR